MKNYIWIISICLRCSSWYITGRSRGLFSNLSHFQNLYSGTTEITECEMTTSTKNMKKLFGDYTIIAPSPSFRNVSYTIFVCEAFETLCIMNNSLGSRIDSQILYRMFGNAWNSFSKMAAISRLNCKMKNSTEVISPAAKYCFAFYLTYRCNMHF